MTFTGKYIPTAKRQLVPGVDDRIGNFPPEGLPAEGMEGNVRERVPCRGAADIEKIRGAGYRRHRPEEEHENQRPRLNVVLVLSVHVICF